MFTVYPFFCARPIQNVYNSYFMFTRGSGIIYENNTRHESDEKRATRVSKLECQLFVKVQKY